MPLKWSYCSLLVLQSTFHLYGMIIIFFFLWSPTSSLVFVFCVSVKLLSECCFISSYFVALSFGVVSNFISIGITIDNIGLKWYRTLYIQSSISVFIGKKQLAFSLSAPNVADPGTVNTFQMQLETRTAGSTSLRETQSHTECVYQLKHSCSPLSRCVPEMQITIINHNKSFCLDLYPFRLDWHMYYRLSSKV